MEDDFDTPVKRSYRTNGMVWAEFTVYADGTEEPSNIFQTFRQMLIDASRCEAYSIDYRPQELGIETEDELIIVRELAAIFDGRLKDDLI